MTVFKQLGGKMAIERLVSLLFKDGINKVGFRSVMSNQPSQRKKMIPYWLTLLIGVILSCIVMNVITNSAQSGAPTSWTVLSGAPSGVTTIVAASFSQVWVETQDSSVYTADIHFACENEGMCWEWKSVESLSEVPEQIYPVSRGKSCETLHDDNSPPKPKGEIIECVYAYERGAEYQEEGYFALMSDGNVLYSHGGSNSIATQILFAFSTFIFPLIVAIIISAVYLVIYVIRRDFRKT